MQNTFIVMEKSRAIVYYRFDSISFNVLVVMMNNDQFEYEACLHSASVFNRISVFFLFFSSFMIIVYEL